jgi:glutamine amidotransferase
MTARVGVIDYGAGNIGSIFNMLARVGAEGSVVRTPDQLGDVDRAILPGVGHFDHGVAQLKASGLFDALRALDVSSTRLLGICLGMQLLLDGSDEGELPGLGLIPGRCHRFEAGLSERKIPHMGWNLVAPRAASGSLAGQLPDSRYYFVHSYYAAPDDPAHVAGTTEYIQPFCSVLDRGDGVAGYQFHPEKSHRYGMALLSAFVAAP